MDFYDLAKPTVMPRDMHHVDRWRWLLAAVEIEEARLTSGFLQSCGNYVFLVRRDKAHRVAKDVAAHISKLEAKNG